MHAFKDVSMMVFYLSTNVSIATLQLHLITIEIHGKIELVWDPMIDICVMVYSINVCSSRPFAFYSPQSHINISS